MKNLILPSILIWFTVLISACKEKSPITPELISLPEANYMYEMKTNDTSKIKTFFINAVYISNEITNKQYREFTNWAKDHPEETLIKTKDIIIRKYESGKKLVYTAPWPAKVSDLLPTLIDSNALYKLDKRFKNYFTDPRFDDYPVVGVSRNAAEYYCKWLDLGEIETTTKHIKTKGQLFPSKVTVSSNSANPHRLPSEIEWQYVSNHPYNKRFENDYRLHRVTEGTTNRKGIFHINDNVSEWVAVENDTLALVRGGNWFQKKVALDKFWLHPDSSNGYTGFRIAMTYRSVSNKENK